MTAEAWPDRDVQTSTMRILFTSLGGSGHLYPLLPLLRAAAAAGDEVLAAAPPDGVSKVAAFGFPATALPVPDPTAYERAWARRPDTDVNGWVAAEIFARVTARVTLPGAVAAIERFQPDVVVSEVAEFSGAIAAEAAGIPRLAVGIAALDADILDQPILLEALEELRAEAGGPSTQRLPWRDSRYASAVPPMLWENPSLAPEDWIWFRHEDPEGPLSPPQPRDSTARARVYATLGSVTASMDHGANVYRDVLTALGEVDADVLFTVGSLDPALLPSRPVNVTVEGYVPQSEAMLCDLVVSHGGTGTTVAALARGLPIVTVPIFADQPHNAARLSTLGVGLTVPVATVRDALPRAAEAVLNDRSYAARSARVAADIAARPPAAAALDAVRPSGTTSPHPVP